ncbi:PIG-X [Choanephora cucurbitarum]|nr:PIG-X [Choanephora cucurbitarum]
MAKVRSRILQASSLHPKIETTIETENNRNTSCRLDVIYVLPPSIFVDPYQLKNLPSLGKVTVFGEHDLELPLEKIKEMRGSIVFLRQPVDAAFPLSLELPFHLRYQQPSHEKTSQPIIIQPPFAGWTCHSEHESPWPPLEDRYTLVPSLPFRATFTQLSHEDSPLTISVPVGKMKDAFLVTTGTFCAVALCTLWIARSIFISIEKRKKTDAKGKRRKSE